MYMALEDTRQDGDGLCQLRHVLWTQFIDMKGTLIYVNIVTSTSARHYKFDGIAPSPVKGLPIFLHNSLSQLKRPSPNPVFFWWWSYYYDIKLPRNIYKYSNIQLQQWEDQLFHSILISCIIDSASALLIFILSHKYITMLLLTAVVW